MIDDAAKVNLYDYLKHEREAVLAKLDGLSEYDARRPLTVTGSTCWAWSSTWRPGRPGTSARSSTVPFPEPLPRWDIEAERLADMWATEHESRRDVVDRYRWVHRPIDTTVPPGATVLP